MADPPERLFRDDAGAALERVHRLEQENQALRAEIEHIKAGRTIPIPAPYRVGTIALCIATIAVGATLALSSAAQPEVVIVQTPSPPPPMPPPPVVQPLPPVPTCPYDDCRAPFWYDANGVKHHMPQSLTR